MAYGYPSSRGDWSCRSQNIFGQRTLNERFRRSTFPAGQPADPDELQVEFERRVAWLLIASSANFIPISAAWFVCDWPLLPKLGRIVAVRHRINLPYEYPQRKQRQLAKRAKHRKGKAAARATTVHLVDRDL
jgi:hypothetical protein